MMGFEALSVTAVPTSCGSTLHCHHSVVDYQKDRPVLILLHGWPQSKFMWRHVIPTLSETHRLLVADLPGYGESTPSTENDRLTVGTAVLEATREIYGTANIVFVCHDRGARTAQRIASHWPSIAKDFPTLNLIAACLMDIVPYKDQWEGFANPRIGVGYFHWPFLARQEISTPMIKAYGGGRFARDCMLATQGTNEAGRALLAADAAIEHYVAYFDRHSNIEAAAADYAAGATVDYELQIEDQKSGDENRKIGVPTLVFFSERNLGRAFPDMQGVWEKWVRKGTDLRCIGIGGDVGHYLPEEAPQDVLDELVPWLQQLTSRASL